MDAKLAQQIRQMRETLIAGSGGSAVASATELKALLVERFDDAWREKVRFAIFDTVEEPISVTTADGRIITLEPNVEIFNIGNVPLGSIVRNIAKHSAIEERLGGILHKLPPVTLKHGAKQTRPLGLVSMYWNFSIIERTLEDSMWHLAGREQAETDNELQMGGINVFNINSICGGTGSGTFIDLAHVIRDIANQLGQQGEFCQITNISLLPKAFRGVKGPNLLPNTGAALEEINHSMVRGGFHGRYPSGRVISNHEAPFDLVHVIDGVDERGQTWASFNDLTAMVAKGIFLQMGSQLGRKGANAFDNLDDVLINQNADGEGTFLSSFGIATIEFPAQQVADYCAARALLSAIETQWLLPASDSHSAEFARQHLQPLTQAQLVPQLLWDTLSQSEIRIELSEPETLMRMRADVIADEAIGFVTQYQNGRLKDTFAPQIKANQKLLSAAQKEQWETIVESALFQPDSSLPHLVTVLVTAKQQVGQWLERVKVNSAELGLKHEKTSLALTQAATALHTACDSFPMGRQGRIRVALQHYFDTAQTHCHQLLTQRIQQALLAIWTDMDIHLDRLQKDVGRQANRLAALRKQLVVSLPIQGDQLANGGVATIRLATARYVDELYRQFAPQQVDPSARLRKHLGGQSLRAMTQLDLDALRLLLIDGIRDHFRPIAAIGVEQAIADQRDEMSARARREQLFRLATPSWNINPARLPEGGQGLVRLEVMGVPDSDSTLFKGEKMMVSTGDSQRLLALSVVAGAPMSALQQHDEFMREMEKVRQRKPLFVLPDFITDGKQARLSFALGLIFGIVQAKGTFFYYKPTDTLASPLKLANGLNAAIGRFGDDERLVEETTERVEGQIAHLGLQQAIDILTRYYSQAPTRMIDETQRELKQLVRDYADELRSIHDLRAGFEASLNGKGVGG